MTPVERLDFLSRLQQIISNSEDDTVLMNILLPEILGSLNLKGAGLQFVSAIFNDGTAPTSFFTDVTSKNITPADGVIKWQVLFTEGPLEKDMLWGHLVIAPNDNLMNPGYAQRKLVNALIIYPITIVHKLSGVLILGSTKKPTEIPNDEVEFLEVVSGLVSSTYRLQDTQTSLVKVTQEVYKMNAELHQLDKLKDDFVSIASHELRTPMTAIRSYVWMALFRPDIVLSEKMKTYLSRTLKSTERLINLVNDMLNVSRIEAGRIEITPVAMDMVKLSKEVMEEVKPRATELGINLATVESKIPNVFADPDKVHEVLLNLIGNALKFTPSGGTIAISFFTDGKVVDISIKDTGQGIPRDDMIRLFHKFERLDNSFISVSTSGGTGLGLYISKSLVELMHGKIWAASEGTGRGSTFSFSLPIATVEVLKSAEKFAIKPVGEAKELEPVAI